MRFEIPVITNSFFDLTKFDFSFAGIEIYDIESEKFKDYIKSLNPDFLGANFSFFEEIKSSIHGKNNKRFAIVKNDYKNDYNSDDLYNVYLILLIVFPSGLFLEHIVHYQDEDNFVQRTYMSTLEKKYVREEDFLDYDEQNLPTINEFLKAIFKKIQTKSYIGLSIENYINSFTASHIHFKYITLCMALENLTVNASELSYRLKRITSILCGDDNDNCELIFDNLTKIYKLRSTIVHGDDYSLDQVNDYMQYLQALVSLTIIELLVHDIPNTSLLDKKITSIGFGQRNLLSENWKKFDLNIITINEIKRVLKK